MTTKEMIQKLRKADPSGSLEVYAFSDGEGIVGDFKTLVTGVLPGHDQVGKNQVHLVVSYPPLR